MTFNSEDLRNSIVDNLKDVYNFNKEESENICDKLEIPQLIRLYSILRAEKINQIRRAKTEYLGQDWLFDFFTIESISKLKSNDYIKSFFIDNLTDEDKIKLLLHYQFSEEYEWGETRIKTSHLMREDMVRDQKFVNEYSGNHDFENDYCIQGLCLCEIWVRKNKNIDCYINILQEKFKNLRNSMVHDSSMLAILPVYKEQNESSTIRSIIIDMYSTCDYKKHIIYECDIDPKEYFQITWNSKREFLLNNL